MRLSTNLMAILSLALLLQTGFATGSALADDTAATASTASTASTTTTNSTKVKSKFKKPKGDDFDGTRSMNMFQIEPTVINERYYTSGQAEHHQKISPTLPYGAPIPDTEGPYAPPAPKADGKPQTSSEALEYDKLDSQTHERLTELQAIKNDSPALKLKLRVSAIDNNLVSELKALKVDVIASAPASGDMIIYAPARNVGDIGHLKEVLQVVLAQ